MEKLKPCPFCGSTNVEISPYGGAKAVACMDCFCRSEIFEGENTKEKAIAAWNRRAAPQSKVLTVDELRRMKGQPVYCIGQTRFDVHFDSWKVVAKNNITADVIRFTDNTDFPNEVYGKRLLAYARKPEGSETL